METSYSYIIDLEIFEPGVVKDYEKAKSALAEALQLARQSDWLAGQAYVLFNICGLGVTNGEVERSLEIGNQALQITLEIGHQQWLTFGHLALGVVYAYLLQFEIARDYFEKGLALAGELGSAYWTGNGIADLVPVYLSMGNLAGAEKIVAEYKPLDPAPQLQSERRAFLAAAKVALAQGQPHKTLEIIEKIIASFPDPILQQPGPDVLKVKAQAEMALGQWEDARSNLLQASKLLEKWEIVPLRWQIHELLYSVYSQLKQPQTARPEIETARRLVRQYGGAISNSDLREHFLAAAFEKFPAERPLTTRQARRLDYEGLTAREQEVATQIALGKSNREIGQVLTLSERTIEAHVGRILSKLDFNSRSQVAVWAVEKGLTAH